MVKTLQILNKNHGKVDKVLVVVDRESGAKEKIENLNVELIPLLSVSEILGK